MIVHHSIGAQFDGKGIGGLVQFIFKPVSAMLEALAGVVINTAEKRTANTTRHAVIVGGLA